MFKSDMLPKKSMTKRPSENRPVGCLKNVSPYGGKAAGGLLACESMTKFPVSAKESPKLIIDL